MAGAPGFEPGFSRSKRDVLPLDEAPIEKCGGLGGDRTLASRLKAECSALELRARCKQKVVDREGLEPSACRVRTGCSGQLSQRSVVRLAGIEPAQPSVTAF